MQWTWKRRDPMMCVQGLPPGRVCWPQYWAEHWRTAYGGGHVQHCCQHGGAGPQHLHGFESQHAAGNYVSENKSLPLAAGFVGQAWDDARRQQRFCLQCRCETCLWWADHLQLPWHPRTMELAVDLSHNLIAWCLVSQNTVLQPLFAGLEQQQQQAAQLSGPNRGCALLQHLVYDFEHHTLWKLWFDHFGMGLFRGFQPETGALAPMQPLVQNW